MKKSLKDLIQTTVKEVTISDGSTVVLHIKKQTIGEQRELLKKYPNMETPWHSDGISAWLEVLASQIYSRDFEDEINKENLNLLPADDITIMLVAMKWDTQTEKKD